MGAACTTGGASARVDEGVASLRSWYAQHRRELPWRTPGIPAWHVLVSEVMLQQTPVARVVPAYHAWLGRWPGPAELAAASPADVLCQWDRLGYPRRALRLQAAAAAIVARHRSQVPTELDALLALPGVGEYTARAVAAFAHGQRAAVVDTNVRRVVVRWAEGRATAARLPLAAVERLLPADPAAAVLCSAALMELGAVVCTARAPRCSSCPLAADCAWRGAGYPPDAGPPRRSQAWEGTVRQARGRILALLRAAPCHAGDLGLVPAALLDRAVPDPDLRRRAVAGLISDGLAAAVGSGLALPG